VNTTTVVVIVITVQRCVSFYERVGPAAECFSNFRFSFTFFDGCVLEDDAESTTTRWKARYKMSAQV
jgi:hypothetical protein